MYYSIAIDGPAAAGKTTQAKALARGVGLYLCRHRRHVPGVRCSQTLAGKKNSDTKSM